MTLKSKVKPKSDARVLCVDDDEAVLSGIGIYLRRQFHFYTATSGAEALELIEKEDEFSVIVSDMRMPGMNGAEFLEKVRTVSPRSTRLLLTGESNLKDAISAINDGQIFRFLTKPTPPKTLTAAIEDAHRHHQLLLAEEVLLEQTLKNSIRAITDILALANPVASGRASQIGNLVGELAALSDQTLGWEIEVAAMVSQLGSVTLDSSLAQRYYGGAVLDEEELRQIRSIPETAAKLLESIPRLEGVLAILDTITMPPNDAEEMPPGADLLVVAEDYLQQIACQRKPEQAIAELRKLSRHHGHGKALALLEQYIVDSDKSRKMVELPFQAVKVGMVFAEDIHLETGVLLVACGYTATQSFVARSLNMDTKLLPNMVRVYVDVEVEDDAVAV